MTHDCEVHVHNVDPPKEADITQPNNTTSTWTDERIEKLKALHSNGISFARIAALMGISRNSCIGKAGRLGLSMRGKGYQGPVREHKPRETKPRASRAKLRLVVTNVPKHIVEVHSSNIIPRNLSIVELKANDCRFPYTTPEESIVFCGHEKIPGSSYCSGHFRLCRYEDTRRRDGLAPKYAMNMAEVRAFGGRP